MPKWITDSGERALRPRGEKCIADYPWFSVRVKPTRRWLRACDSAPQARLPCAMTSAGACRGYLPALCGKARTAATRTNRRSCAQASGPQGYGVGERTVRSKRYIPVLGPDRQPAACAVSRPRSQAIHPRPLASLPRQLHRIPARAGKDPVLGLHFVARSSASKFRRALHSAIPARRASVTNANPA